MRRQLGYTDGVGATLAALALIVVGYYAVAGVGLVQMYGASHVKLPALTLVVLHPAWRYGVPLAIVAGLVLGHVKATRFALLAVGLVAIALAIVTHLGAWAPITALAGNIKG